MIISKTPLRISFVGGGSDLEEFYSRYPGAVLSTTIDQAMYISCHEFFDEDKIRVKYSRTETVTDLDDLRHPLVREVLRKFDIHGAVEISSNADVPAGTGLGSSSSFTVGLLHTLYAREGTLVSKERLAREACEIEIEKVGEPIGKQDQYATAFGGLNVIVFNPSGQVNVERLHLKREHHRRLARGLLMFYTGKNRDASSILLGQKKGLGSQDKLDIQREMVSLVWRAKEALYSGDMERFASILHESWQLKKQMSENITDDDIDAMYERAREAGALGGKLLGAGGGGFLMLWAEPESHERIEAALEGSRRLRIRLDNEGSKIIYAGEEW